MSHIMLDLETWGTATDAMVVSIGAARFDPYGSGIIDSFEVHIDPVDAQRYSPSVSAATVLWWMHKDRAVARAEWLAKPRTDVGTALEGFWQWCHDAPDRESGEPIHMWGNGAAFDCVILRTLHEKAGLDTPWAWYNDRCYRTMKSLPGAPELDARVGTYHSAVDDAVTQALHLQKICAALKLGVHT